MPRLSRPTLRAASAAAVAAVLLTNLTACAVRVAGVPIAIPAPGDPGRRGSSGAPASAVAGRALRDADRYVGVPYRWGGTSPATGFDCSGLVQYAYGREGVGLPRTSRQQALAGVGRPARWDAAAPGDLVMFAEPGEPISHVAFYAGGRTILHASSSGGGVRYDDLDTRRGRWYRERLVAVRRVSARGPAVARALLERFGVADVPLDPPDPAPRPR